MGPNHILVTLCLVCLFSEYGEDAPEILDKVRRPSLGARLLGSNVVQGFHVSRVLVGEDLVAEPRDAELSRGPGLGGVQPRDVAVHQRALEGGHLEHGLRLLEPRGPELRGRHPPAVGAVREPLLRHAHGQRQRHLGLTPVAHRRHNHAAEVLRCHGGRRAILERGRRVAVGHGQQSARGTQRRHRWWRAHTSSYSIEFGNFVLSTHKNHGPIVLILTPLGVKPTPSLT
mmetsp:Transcript_67968/g.153804  ORF Transcript_67968/g.153804 Transcript_67968/m.153804 type:complete len:229 (-) Transcript_67968:42-728(-)